MDPHGTFEEELASFAAELRRLRLERGNRSYRDLAARAAKTGNGIRLPVATQSDAFRGKRLLGFDTLMALVRILHAYDEYGQEVPVPPHSAPALDGWRARWRSLAALQPTVPARPRVAPSAGPPPDEVMQASRPPTPERGSPTAVPERSASGDSLASRALVAALDNAEPVELPPLDMGHPLFRVAFSPDGRILATATGGGSVLLRDPVTRQALGELDALPWALAFSPDGTALATSANGEVRVWDLPDLTLRFVLTGLDSAVKRVVFSPDGQLLAVASADRTVLLWDMAAGRVPGGPLIGHTGLAFSPDGSRLATSGADQPTHLWDVPHRRGLPGRPLQGHKGTVWAVAFAPDGRMLVTAGADGTVRRWDPNIAEPLGAPLTGHRGDVYEVAFTPDGRLLVTSGADGTVRLWDPVTGAAVGDPLPGHSLTVGAVAFSPDGSLLASGGLDGRLRRWIVGRA
ncbi:WD40 repeat domain-containing protein [Streptomyces sp. NBC_00162]|uniref:WD40 repeat domain-containing protein n=1 Tax=Streptomyces sp. NBC_00162 TaxID=2903629 RepID=UPI00214C57AF|nr:WD40 repeat domain-containing protein [Streptomyces sp. NBC_00162]UUU43453.1 WD40 repeat domain-containing protein [Streptomyces sp. NBC_00162]